MELIQELECTIHTLFCDLDRDQFSQRLFAGDISTDEYASFLAQTYLYVRHTRPLLMRAARRLAGAPELAALFQRKADEESGHERWALADLRALGRDIDLARRTQPTKAVAAYIAWNTFTVECGSPVAFLGTAYVLEALAAARAAETVKNLLQQRRIEGIERAVTFLRGHADADLGHVAELAQRLLVIAQGPADREAVALSARITATLYGKLVSEVGLAPPLS